MTSNRLDYQTTAGQISESDTFAQLLEHLRLAQECCNVIGHIRAVQDDTLVAKGWHGIAEMLKMTQTNVTNIATKKLRASSGFK